MHTLTCTVPLPPTTNNAYPTGKGGRRRLSEKGREYKHEAGWLVKIAASEQEWSAGARHKLTLHFYFPHEPTAQRKCDLDNHVKLLADTIAEVLGFDDATIDVMVLERAGVDIVRPRCEVRLEHYDT